MRPPIGSWALRYHVDVSQSPRDALWREAAFAACLYAALTLVMAYPLTRHPASTAVQHGADTNLLLWLIQWNAHGFLHQPLSIFDANIFYPFRHTLAYAENVIGSAILAAPVLWVSGNPVLALNVVTLLSIVLCGLGAFLLMRRLGIGALGATLGGLIFAFAPPRFFRFGQLHLTTVQWMPFCLFFLHTYLDGGRRRDLWWACAFFALQALTSGHGAVFTAIGILALFAWRAAWGEPIRALGRLRDLHVPGIALLVLTALVFLPYRAAQLDVGLRRSLGESYSFTPGAASFLASPTHLHTFLLSRFTDGWVLRDATSLLFPGYLTLAFAMSAVWIRLRSSNGAPRPPRDWAVFSARLIEVAFLITLVIAVVVTMTGGFRWRWGAAVLFSAREPLRAWGAVALLLAVRIAMRRRVPFGVVDRIWQIASRYREAAPILRNDPVAFYGVLGLVSLWLALGSPFLLYRLVYSWPGFSFIRVPARFTLITLLCLSVLAAWGFERLTRRWSVNGRRLLAVAAGAVLAVEFFAAPIGTASYAVDVPRIDRWLDGQPKPFVVAEFPLDGERDGIPDAHHSLYMLHSAGHWQRTIHGYSGIQPAFHTQLYDELTSFPDDSAVVSLASLGVKYVVVHPELYGPGKWEEVAAQLENSPEWLKLLHTEGADRVYAVSQPPLDALLRRRHDDFVASLGAGDARLRSFYADAAVIVDANGAIVSGRTAIDAWIEEEGLERGRMLVDSAIDHLSIQGGEGYVTGRLDAMQHSGAGQRGPGRYVEVWRFFGNEWLLVSHILTAPFSPARH